LSGLYHENGNWIADDDDGGVGFNSRLHITLERGEYILEARDSHGEGIAFTLLVE
jgi:hypothetical protein